MQWMHEPITSEAQTIMQMIKNIKKGTLLNLKMLMASAYSASRLSQSSRCCNLTHNPCHPCQGSVASRQGWQGSAVLKCQVEQLMQSRSLMTLDITEASEELENLLEINVECCTPSKLFCNLCAWLTAWPVHFDLIVILCCWWSLASLPTSSQSLTVNDGKDGLQQSLNFTVAYHVMTCIATGT